MVLRSKVIDHETLSMIALENGVGISGSTRILRGDVYRTDFTLKLSEATPKHKEQTARYQRRGMNWRRISAVCWHGHRDIMRSIFNVDPDARLTSAMADYRGAESFERTFEATGERNIGSMMQPLAMQDACDCDQREDVSYV